MQTMWTPIVVILATFLVRLQPAHRIHASVAWPWCCAELWLLAELALLSKWHLLAELRLRCAASSWLTSSALDCSTLEALILRGENIGTALWASPVSRPGGISLCTGTRSTLLALAIGWGRHSTASAAAEA